MRILVFVLSLCACAQSDLIKALSGETPMKADLEELCDHIGGRITGSAACNRAVAWAEKKFKEAGVDNVWRMPYRVPSLWLPVTASAAALAPEDFPLRVMAAPGSVGVNLTSVKLVDIGEGKPEDFAKARGAVALVMSKQMTDLEDLFGEYQRTPALIDAAEKAGAAAILLQSMHPRGLLSQHPISLNGETVKMPFALVAREQAGRLQRLAAQGDVRISLRLDNSVGPAFQAEDVVAEIKGREKPEEVVLIGAHLDSWNSGTGAEDNGVNCALVIDLARQMAKLKLRPRRSIRFALFTGEEQGMWGSSGYVRRHMADLKRHVAVVIFDIGSGHTSGFWLNGRPELRTPLEEALKAGGFDGMSNSDAALDGTDNFDFLLAGVPNLVAIQDDKPYVVNYHAESDTFDKVNWDEAKRNAGLAAAVVWGLANRAEWPAPQQTRAEVEELIKRTRLDEQMKLFGQWAAWEAKKRP